MGLGYGKLVFSFLVVVKSSWICKYVFLTSEFWTYSSRNAVQICRGLLLFLNGKFAKNHQVGENVFLVWEELSAIFSCVAGAALEA